MKKTYIIASQRPWNAGLANRLMERTGLQFISICDPNELTAEKLKALDPIMIFFPHWSSRIPVDVWQQYESIIFHMTDLPYGRGGSPLQNLITRGHQNTVISALRCVEEMDAGPIYMKRPLDLSGSAEDIFYRADKIIEDMIVDILEIKPIAEVQTGEVTLFKRRKPEDSNLLNAKSLDDIYNLIRMLDAEGYPHAFLNIGDIMLEFRQASHQSDYVQATVIIRSIS